jgi:hypothetical protein
MIVWREELEHPVQASRVRLSVYQQSEKGFLVTEERIGTLTVVATLGAFDEREAAQAAASARAETLRRQSYRAATPAA